MIRLFATAHVAATALVRVEGLVHPREFSAIFSMLVVRVQGIRCQWYRLGPEQANTRENIHPSRVQPHSRFILMICLLSCRGESANTIQVGMG